MVAQVGKCVPLRRTARWRAKNSEWVSNSLSDNPTEHRRPRCAKAAVTQANWSVVGLGAAAPLVKGARCALRAGRALALHLRARTYSCVFELAEKNPKFHQKKQWKALLESASSSLLSSSTSIDSPPSNTFPPHLPGRENAI